MIAPRLRRVALAALAGAATSGGVALAQESAPATGGVTPAPAGPVVGNFGGGALRVPVSETTIAKDMLLSIRALPRGRARLDGHIYTRCGLGTISGDTKVAADGSFVARGETARRPVLGVRETTRFVVRGRMTAPDQGEGTARLNLRVRVRGHRTRTCRSHTVTWFVRRPGPAAAAAPAPAEATLYGLTSQKGPRARRAIVLHTASEGRRVDRLTFGFRTTCSRRRIVVADDLNVSPEFDVAADGSFRYVERFKVTYADVIARTTVVVRGQFDASGGAAGKLAVTERYVNRRSGRRVDVCRSGVRRWAAQR